MWRSLGALAATWISVVASSAQTSWPNLQFVETATGLSAPVGIAAPDDGSGRLFIVEQAGRIRILDNGTLTTFLDIAERVKFLGEQGLLGLAFPPDFASKGYFYINYTSNIESREDDTVIARFHLETDDTADPDSEEILLVIDQPDRNHNGGQIQFGPDGYLYIGMGDGGSAQDPDERAQNPMELLGKMLRIDVEGGDDFPADINKNYAIPPDNPFVDNTEIRDEIWALGLRNPWRFTFDRNTGDLYIADVGQISREEINFQPADSTGGENYGWDFYEANLLTAYNPGTPPDASSLTFPVANYSHSLGCSVTGGYVYRGKTFPRMNGVYFYADYCSGRIWGLQRNAQQLWLAKLLVDTDYRITTFGEDADDNLFFVDINTGTLYELEDSRDSRYLNAFNFAFNNDEFIATFGVDSTKTYNAEWSQNLTQWTSFGTFPSGGHNNRRITIVDDSFDTETIRFYRLVEQP